MVNLPHTVAFRLTPGEKGALAALAVARSAQLVARGELPDEGVGGLLRALIRREAKAAGIDVDAAPTPPAATKASP